MWTSSVYMESNTLVYRLHIPNGQSTAIYQKGLGNIQKSRQPSYAATQLTCFLVHVPVACTCLIYQRELIFHLIRYTQMTWITSKMKPCTCYLTHLFLPNHFFSVHAHLSSWLLAKWSIMASTLYYDVQAFLVPLLNVCIGFIIKAPACLQNGPSNLKTCSQTLPKWCMPFINSVWHGSMYRHKGMSSFPDAEEGEKERLVHTVCACA